MRALSTLSTAVYRIGTGLRSIFGSWELCSASRPAFKLASLALMAPLIFFLAGCGGGSNAGIGQNSTSSPNPVPLLASVSPSVAPAGPPTVLAIAGSGFVSSSQVQINGKTVPAVFVSATQLTATAAFSTAGSEQITVANPAPGGGISSAIAISVLTPSLVSLDTSAASIGQPITLHLSGADISAAQNNVIQFVQGGLTFNTPASQIASTGIGITGLPSAVLTAIVPSGMAPSSTQANLGVPASLGILVDGVAATGTATLTVQPPSHALLLTPSAAAPGTSLSVTAVGVSTHFSASTVLSADSGITISAVQVASPTQIVCTVSLAGGALTGSHTITATTGSEVIPFPFSVLLAAPQSPKLTGLSITSGSPLAPLVLSGSGFSGVGQANTSVVIQYAYGSNVLSIPATANSDTSITTYVPPLLNSTAGAFYSGPVSVLVSVNGQQTGSLPFTLQILPANAGAVGTSTLAYLDSYKQTLSNALSLTQANPAFTQTEINSLASFDSAALANLAAFRAAVVTASTLGSATLSNGTVLTQSGVDTLDRFLQQSQILQLPAIPSPLIRTGPSAQSLARPLASTFTFYDTTEATAASYCSASDKAGTLNNVLGGVATVSCLGTAFFPPLAAVCGVTAGISEITTMVTDATNIACDAFPVNLQSATFSPVNVTQQVNGNPVFETPSAQFGMSPKIVSAGIGTVFDLSLAGANGQLESLIQTYMPTFAEAGQNVVTGIIGEITGSFQTLLGAETNTPLQSSLGYTQSVTLTSATTSFLSPTNGFPPISGLAVWPSANAGTANLQLNLGEFRLIATDSQQVSGNNLPVTIQTVVIVTPSTVSIPAGAQQPFTSVVNGTSNQNVTWSVDGVSGGNATVGTISASGLYVAPGTSATHTISAKAAFDGSLGNATVTVVPNNPPPLISNLSPTSLPAGSAPQALTINGSGFMPSSTVTFSGVSHTPTYISALQLTIALTAVDLATAGPDPVVVTNPPPGGGASGSVVFTVTTSAPVLSISPTSVTVPAHAVQTFAATVPGGGSATWSIQEGAAGGTITSAGIYTASGTTGTFHVIATNSANSAQTATATVSVTTAVPYSTLYSFPYAFESAALIQGTDGNFYGTNEMIAYKINSSFNFTQLAQLSTSPVAPISSLIQASDGNYYGISSYNMGSIYDTGTVFKMNSSGNVSNLYTFPYPTSGVTAGSWPWAGLIQGTDGTFYGTTYAGGNLSCTPFGYGVPAYGPFDYNPTAGYGCGTVFRMDSSGNVTVLYSFSGQSDGNFPQASLIQGSDGSLYGTTSAGGAHGYGTIFKISTSGIMKTLHSFSGADGNGPVAALLQAADGNLYGTTSSNSSGGGEAFRIDTAGNNFTILHTFSGVDGFFPVAPLIQGSDGSFYGTTWAGGDLTCGSYYYNVGSNYPYPRAGGCGTVFKMDSAGNITVLHAFEEPQSGDGNAPYAGLLFGKDGYLYGTTYYGGTSIYFGTVFRLGT